MADLTYIFVALVGTFIGSIVGLVPGLHVYNIAGLALLLFSSGAFGVFSINDELLAFLLLGMTIGWVLISILPSTFLFAPDDNSVVAVLPATKFVLQGRGYEAVMLIGVGALASVVCLLAFAPLLDAWLRPIRAIIQPHTPWMLLAITLFLLLGEWSRVGDGEPTPLRRLAVAWAYLGAGLLTFVLSGLLGIVLMTRSPISIETAFQNLLPAFVGLFTLPSLIQVLVMGVRVPKQQPPFMQVLPTEVIRSGITGTLGGLFASVLPVVTGGMGGLLAGHATAQWGDRQFLISHGASKTAYFVGSLLLLFVPGLGLTRGGMAWMLTTTFVPYGWRYFALCVAAIGTSSILAFALLWLYTRLVSHVVHRVSPYLLASGATLVAIASTYFFTGLAGVLVAGVAMCIGLIPVFVGGRRLNGLGVLLVPILLNMTGASQTVVRWLGL
jgi:putative membrane protein